MKYEFDTGNFIWLKNRNGRNLNSIAGYKDSRGYVQIRFNKKIHYAHRLVFLYIEGYLPENDIDHIDRDKSNNKWENLRHVSRSCNMKNTNLQKNNKSGIKGVCWNKSKNKWKSYIAVNKKLINLNHSSNLDDAVLARWEAEVKYDFPNCNSTSTSYLYLKEKGLIN